jgi:hypothetical protein
MADAWLFTDEIDQFHADLTLNREKPAHAYYVIPVLGPTRLPHWQEG